MNTVFQKSNWRQDRAVLERCFGIHLPQVVDYTSAHGRAMDSVSPITAANNGILAQFSSYLDPQIIDVLVAPTKAAQIYGEAQKGNWLNDTMIFAMVESGGSVAAYGDYHNNGQSHINTVFPQRQQFVVQTFAEWGDREVGRAGLANIDLPNRKRMASALNLNIWQNRSYFFGVEHLQNFGALNDPNLLPAITPHAKADGGTVWENATAMEIYNDILKLYRQLQAQTKGIISLDDAVTMDSPLKLVLSNEVQPNLLKTNEYGNSVMDMLKKNFPNLTQVSAPELSTEGGELVQMFVETYQGVDTFTCAFSEKLRSHGIVRETSSTREKMTQGSWGTILTRPVLVTQMIGV